MVGSLDRGLVGSEFSNYLTTQLPDDLTIFVFSVVENVRGGE
jgi:hypothetical protein